MKNISRFCLLILALMMGISAMGQAPQKFGFQAVARNAAGRLASNQSVGLRVSILQGTPTGTMVYAETHTVTTNSNGLFSVNIGEGTVFAGNFSTINWANGPYFIKSEIDINGGSNYTLVSTQQMISVPYALHAFQAERLTTPIVETQILSIGHDTIFLTGGSFVKLPAGFSGSYNDLTNKPTIPTIPTNVSAFANDAGYLTSFSESQILSIGHDTVYLTGGSFVVLPAGFSGNYNDLTNKPTIPTVPTNVSAFTNDAGYITSAAVPTNVSSFTNDAGYLTSFSESQVLSIGHDTVYLTGGSFVVLPAGFSGNYNDLTNKPTIPTVPSNVSSFTNDAGYITSSAVPANVSAFTNDAGYMTTYTETQNLSAVVANGNSAGHSQIKNVNDPTDPKDAVNKRYLDSLFSLFQHRIDSLSTELTLAGGELTGTFSVSAGSTVKFSRGNLQYQASTNTWRFAQNQYDTIGSSNSNISSSYTGWIDLFGWGTSGWNSGSNCYQPYSTSTTYSDYYPGGSSSNNLTGSYANADWGVYNLVSNGGNQAGRWRTLTQSEWDYLFNTRSASTVNGTANARYCKATVNGVKGMVLFPDSYTHPSGVAQPSGINTSTDVFATNTYSASQWASMQSAGAVFLPAAGYRYGTNVNYVGASGHYWSSSYYDGNDAYSLRFFGNFFNSSENYNRRGGFSVRLVHDNTVSASITACDHYLWHGTDYTVSGDYTYGSETLHLTINQSTHNSESQSTSGTYTWHGTDYSTTGTYTYDYTNSNGCPSTDTLCLTIISAPAVSTNSISSITSTTATAGGNVTAMGGASVTARGVCWSTTQNPTISDSHTTDGTGTGSFTSSLTGLTAGTTYYVRAYATNSAGTAYGSQVSFTTASASAIVNGALPGTFSVSSTNTVKFSQGNLQYQASTGTWRFAANQYDCIGSANSNISSTYSGWIDLFGWGTSGYHNSSDSYNTRNYPYSSGTSTVSTYFNYYGYGPSANQSSPNLTGASANYDWGVYNPISNGGNLAGRWRTLTQSEWDYLFYTRSTSTVNGTVNARYCKATVNGVKGMVLFPDSYSHPAGVTQPTGINTSDVSFTTNTYTASQWTSMQTAGAVFLPAAGLRDGKSVSDVGREGFYWSVSRYNTGGAYSVWFYDSSFSIEFFCHAEGQSVRLVQDCNE